MRRQISSAIILLAAFLFPIVSIAQNWEWQNPLPQGNTLGDVTFADSLHGWAVGDHGTVLRTVDGGDTWTIIWTGVSANLAAVAFTDTLHGLAVGQNSILSTSDGGMTWTSRWIDSPTGLRDVAMINDSVGWIVGDFCYHTTDGGENWVEVAVPHDSVMVTVKFSDWAHGWVLSARDSIARTTDGGHTWTATTIRSLELWSMDFIDSLNGWVAAYVDVFHYAPARTRDGGLTWTMLPSMPTDIPNVLVFVDSLHGWTVGRGFITGEVSGTADGGLTWHHRGTASGGLNGLCATASGNGWAVGAVGQMLHYPGGDAWWGRASRTIAPDGLGISRLPTSYMGVPSGRTMVTSHRSGRTST